MSQDIFKMSMHKYHGDFQKLSVTVKHSKSQVLSSWGSRDILPYNWTPALIEAPTSKMTKSCCCSIFPSASSSWFSGLFELSILDCLVPRKKLRWIYFSLKHLLVPNLYFSHRFLRNTWNEFIEYEAISIHSDIVLMKSFYRK